MDVSEWYEKEWLDNAFINGLPLHKRKGVIMDEGRQVLLGDKKYPRLKVMVSFDEHTQKEWTVSLACYEALAKEYGNDSKDWIGAVLLFSVDKEFIRVTVLGKGGGADKPHSLGIELV